MSETALRSVNAVLPSERRSVGKKQHASMKVPVSSGPNDENQECTKSSKSCRPLREREPAAAVVAKQHQKVHPNVNQMEAPVEPLAADIEYILSEDLIPLQNANSQLSTLLGRLDSKEWLIVLEALNDVRRLAVFEPASMQEILNNVVTLVIKAMKNPRSALCKTALMATTDLFKAYRDQMLDVLDPLLLQLLLKATQDKRFVCEEAERALVGMTSWISPNPSLEKLTPYARHRNPRVRAKAATCVYKSVSRLGVDGITNYGLEPLIQIAAAQLNDQLPEAREAARKLVVDLHAVHRQCSNQDQPAPKTEDDESSAVVDPWEQFCMSSLTPLTAQAVLRVSCVAN
ncbi:unnamed protein product [Calypogeia fissa]